MKMGYEKRYGTSIRQLRKCGEHSVCSITELWICGALDSRLQEMAFGVRHFNMERERERERERLPS
jgi:hypothetical protein